MCKGDHIGQDRDRRGEYNVIYNELYKAVIFVYIGIEDNIHLTFISTQFLKLLKALKITLFFCSMP